MKYMNKSIEELHELLKEGKVKFPDVELYNLKEYEKAFSSHSFKAGFAF